jgi:hypothetical protein
VSWRESTITVVHLNELQVCCGLIKLDNLPCHPAMVAAAFTTLVPDLLIDTSGNDQKIAKEARL